MSRHEKDVLGRDRRFAFLVGDGIVERVAADYWRQQEAVTEWEHLPDVARDPVREMVGSMLDTAIRESTSPADADDPAAAVRAIHAELLNAHGAGRIIDDAHRPSRDLNCRLQVAYRHLAAAEHALSGLWVAEPAPDGVEGLS